MLHIEKHRRRGGGGAVFSILIPTWNNLECLQLCLRSLERHSVHPHQIIVHVNEGTDGTADWVRQQGFDYTYSPENVGVCYALNAGRTLVETDYFVFFNDDMYACPAWDDALLREIRAVGHSAFFLSSTMIEPIRTGNRCVISPHDFGRSPADFAEEQLLAQYDQLPFADWSGATWPPNVVHLDYWDLVGGYSVEFSPGLYSDPDFSRKLWAAGVRYFKGVAASRVYHFGAKTTGRIRKNKGSRRFLDKWGVTARSFTQYYLRRGEPFAGPLPDEPIAPGWAAARRRGRWKRAWHSLWG